MKSKRPQMYGFYSESVENFLSGRLISGALYFVSLSSLITVHSDEMFAQRYHGYQTVSSYDIETDGSDKSNYSSSDKSNHSWKYLTIIIVFAMMLMLLSLGIYHTSGILLILYIYAYPLFNICINNKYMYTYIRIFYSFIFRNG